VVVDEGEDEVNGEGGVVENRAEEMVSRRRGGGVRWCCAAAWGGRMGRGRGARVLRGARGLIKPRHHGRPLLGWAS
jgi:hypothetical protein